MEQLQDYQKQYKRKDGEIAALRLKVDEHEQQRKQQAIKAAPAGRVAAAVVARHRVANARSSRSCRSSWRARCAANLRVVDVQCRSGKLQTCTVAEQGDVDYLE